MQEWCSCGSAPGYGIQFVCDQEYPWLLVQEWNQLQLGLQAIDQEGHPGIHKALPLENTDKKTCSSQRVWDPTSEDEILPSVKQT